MPVKLSEQIKTILAEHGFEVEYVERSFHAWHRHVMGAIVWGWYFKHTDSIHHTGCYSTMKEFVADYRKSGRLLLVTDGINENSIEVLTGDQTIRAGEREIPKTEEVSNNVAIRG
jgi:hypothetical protein